jgi:hypothetical protein
MRRIIESTQLSLDGVIGSPHLWPQNTSTRNPARQRSSSYRPAT